MSKVKISFVIVTYKADKELKECIKSIRTKIPHEIIVVDNGLPNADVGFGAGINKGVTKAKGEYLFILNPDIQFLPNTIDKIFSFLLEHKDVGIVAPNHKDAKGKIYESLGTGRLTPITAIFGLSFINKIFPDNPVSKYYWMKGIKNNKETKEVEVAPGAAFLISKKLFEEVGKFDEKFFLYFEESDLCKRVREKGFKIFVLNNVYIIHHGGTGTAQTKHVNEIFKASRKYYFEKYYGKIVTFFVELVVNFGRDEAIFIGTILLAVFLRFYRINENLVFHGELGDNYLAIKDSIGKGIVPLLGPPTSHPWLSFGPLFYYIFAPFLILNKWNPNTGAYFFGAISVLGIIANYYVVKKFFGGKSALISSFLIAISTVWIDLARQARFFSMVAYLFYPFFLMTIGTIDKRNTRNFFLLGLIFGTMINFHLAPVFLLPALLVLFWKDYKKIIFGFLGFVVPNIPFLIYNLKTGFSMIAKFAVWIPYRSVIYHNFNLLFTLNEIYVFFGGLFGLVGCLIAIFLFRKNKKIQILTLFLFFGILALVLHKDPPEHYFYVLYPIPVILISILLSQVKSLTLLTSILILVTVTSFSFLFSDKWFFIDQNKVLQSANIPYKLQTEAVSKIVNDANGRLFNLKRVGFSDQFDDYFEQNYDYLLLLSGNEPKKYPVNLVYTIIEYPDMRIIKEIK